MLQTVTLSGEHVELVPLARAHNEALAEAVQDGELWKLWYTVVPTPGAMLVEIDRRLGLQNAGSMLPFSVFDKASRRIIGMTTYMNIDSVAPRVEIGATWYAKGAQKTSINTEAKLLMLSHAFEQINCLAVEFRTHFLNQQSRRAIERTGAKLDGILRNHTRMRDGSLRDTCVYSIIASEWPAVRTHLNWLLGRPQS